VVDWLHGKAALTDYEVLELNDQPSYSSSPVTLVSLVPHTGRTHQLRVHCAHPEGLGMPIVGDALYGRKANRLCLHAAELSFDHPVTGERLHFYRPTDFA
jgi:tRNA pseudouridine32 synthase/23S rRNA pseudouridine746 synthase